MHHDHRTTSTAARADAHVGRGVRGDARATRVRGRALPIALLSVAMAAALTLVGSSAATAAAPAPQDAVRAELATTTGTTTRPRRPRVSAGIWAPHLGRRIVATRATFLGRQLATWYGPGFWGNGTACGQRLRPKSWGIAHRTLPCGTLVTLQHRGRKVTVPVIDRGPYSGATVDLTERTRNYLRFTSGTVNMAQVRRYRLLPLPRPVAGIVAVRPARP